MTSPVEHNVSSKQMHNFSLSTLLHELQISDFETMGNILLQWAERESYVRITDFQPHKRTFLKRTDVLIVANIMISMPCNLVDGCPRFGGTCCLHTLKMEAVRPSETLLHTYQPTQHHKTPSLFSCLHEAPKEHNISKK
jgi:hypothetical protein